MIFIRYILAFCCAFLLPLTAQAQEINNFQHPQNFKEKQVVKLIASENSEANTALVLSKIDLNEDAIYEYILRPQDKAQCPNFPLCPYFIVAFQSGNPRLLGQFDAHKISQSRKKNYGVRTLLLYNVSYNDFKSQAAVWSPHESRYRLE